MNPDDYEECEVCGLEYHHEDLTDGLCDDCLAAENEELGL